MWSSTASFAALLSLGVFASPPPDIVGETPVVTEVTGEIRALGTPQIGARTSASTEVKRNTPLLFCQGAEQKGAMETNEIRS